MVGGQECFVTASVGIAIFPRDGADRGRPAAQLRRRDVLGQGGGAQRGVALPAAPGRQGTREARARERAAQGDRARRTGAALPAEDRRARRAHGRRRGADALAPRRPAGAAGRLHPARRGDRPHRAAQRMGDPRGGAPGARLARQLRLRRLDRGQPAEPAVRAHRPGRVHPQRRSRPTACRTTRSSSRSPRPA